jgi:predicted CXXCH cytochrome family protein
MSKRRCRLLLLSVTGLALGLPEIGFAFHEKGVANCEGCHTTHDSADGDPVIRATPSDWGLLKSNPTDLCLTCHAGQSAGVMGRNPLLPPPELGGGNFVFLLEDNLNDAPDGALRPIPGHAAGHNLVAPEHGLEADPRYSFSPGGNFPSEQMGCTSCHDPHGNANFRMLNGAGPVQDGRFVFAEPAPDAEGVDLSSAGESRFNHTAYRRGMSRWCGNCHGQYHQYGLTGFKHPTEGLLTGAEQTQYELYDGDDNPTGGMATSAYLPEVPFEDAQASIESRFGPSASSRVMCLTCHRAHATSAPAAGRWDFRVAALLNDGVVSGSYRIPSPYRARSQGTLCSKCHKNATGK